MAALPYIQLYVADYLADTAHLTTEEHGAYLLLIFNYWQTGKALREDRLATVARMSNECWTNVEHTLKEFFNVCDGYWFHDRIERDLKAVNERRNQLSMAGKASAKSRKIKKKNRNNKRSTNVQQTLQQNGNHTDTDTDTLIPNGIKEEKRTFNALDCPANINHDAWQAWVTSRKKRRKPITEAAARGQWQALSTLSHDQQARCIYHSINNDYQGLFPEKFSGVVAPLAPNGARSTRDRSITEDLNDLSWAN